MNRITLGIIGCLLSASVTVHAQPLLHQSKLSDGENLEYLRAMHLLLDTKYATCSKREKADLTVLNTPESIGVWGNLNQRASTPFELADAELSRHFQCNEPAASAT